MELEFTVTWNVYGVVGLVMALVESQAEPDVTWTVKATPVAPDVLDTLTLCACGLAPCAVEKASVVGETLTFPVLPPPFTVSVTGTF